MGFSMIEVIRKVRNEINFQSLDMRIGVHTVNNNFKLSKFLQFKGRYNWWNYWDKYC